MLADASINKVRRTALRLHYRREVFGRYGAAFNRVIYNKVGNVVI